jgi:hypothetical protein
VRHERHVREGREVAGPDEDRDEREREAHQSSLKGAEEGRATAHGRRHFLFAAERGRNPTPQRHGKGRWREGAGL